MSDELSVRRVTKQTDNTEVKPVDLLRKILHDIESGETKAGSVLIMIMSHDDDGWDRVTYRAGLTHEQEIALLALAKKRAIERWIGD